MFNIFDKKAGRKAGESQLQQMIGHLKSQIDGGQIITPGVARSALSFESLGEDAQHSLAQAGNELSIALESVCKELGQKVGPTAAQINAGAVAGILAGDYRGFLAHKLDFPAVSTEGMTVVHANGLADTVDGRSFGLEAYDERENRNAVIYSIAYNYQSARQDEFGETFFPTLTLTPDNVGFGITVNLMQVYDGIERKISGDFQNFNKKNIIRAVADPSVLKKEQTRIYPVRRAQSVDKFSTVIGASTIVNEGETIVTAPLAFGKKVDLLGLSQTDTLLASGVMDQTDSIDPMVNLQNVYAKVGDDLLKFNVGDLPLSNFTYATQNNYRVENLMFATTSILLNKNSKQLDGAALDDLAGIVTNDLIVRLEVQVTGNINIETGETNVFANSMSVVSVQDNTGTFLDLTAAPAVAIVTAINSGSMVGYDLLAYRTNMNVRQNGQLIDVTKFTQLYNVPLRSPITTLHPITTDGQSDASDVQALVTATRIRTSNEAVTALIKAAQVLDQYVDVRDEAGAGPDVLGVGRFFVRPAFMKETMDMNKAVDSVKSHERAQDIQAALVNKLRDMAYRLYRDSEYKAAADALAGGMASVPVVIIGTDPVLARYLNVSGDLRTLGGEFEVRIVSSLDMRVKGKIFIAFGTFDDNRNVAPSPLNFGNMIWGPEMVLSANISRNGQISKNTVVQPKYLFVTHCPIMGVLSVENVPDVIGKVTIFTKEQP